MVFKSYNKKFLGVLFCTLFLIALLNILSDPYNIFNVPTIKKFNFYKPDAKRQERLTKFLNLKMLKNVDTVFIGVSRTDWSLDPQYYKKITNKNGANMAMAAADFNEFKEIIYNSIKIHPEIKTILLAVDIEKYMPMITEKTSFDINAENPNITPNEIANVIFSIDTTVSSFVTLVKNISGVERRVYLSNGMKHIFCNNDIESSFVGTINEYGNSGNFFKKEKIDLSELKKFIAELSAKDINVILYIPPLHITFLEIYDYNEAWDGIEKFKKELAKIQPFYDFMYVHPINLEKITPDMKYYFEASHSTYIVGEKILDKVFNNKGDFGVLVNLENVNKHNKINRKNIKLWQKENPETQKWVHKILDNK